ncbi:MAG: NAD(P)/FAD-dependent oxidoreductase [Solirubrobacteraceae bacterium]
MSEGVAGRATDPVVVVGGGAVGLAIAEALTSRGADTIVVERGRCGGGGSAGNAGWITPSLAIPVPGPGVIGESLKWLVNPSGPLWIRPSLSPAMVGWIARFMRGCSRTAYRRGLVALQGAGALAGPAFDRLAERGVEFELHDEPLLYPAFEQAEFEHLLRIADELGEVGGHAPRRLSPGEAVSLEPALGDGVVGGLIADGDRRVRPESLTAGLQQALEARGVQVRQGEPVTALTPDRGRWLLQTSNGSLAASTVVLASGVNTVRLTAPLGLRLPIVAAKGYSRTYEPDPSGPRRAVYLEAPKIAISAFDGGVRVSGTLELGAKGLALSSRRLSAITAGAQRAMPGWRMPPDPQDWAGMRSLSPDGLPVIGAVPGRPGLHVATAHATLGITLAPATGELVAGLLLDGRQDPLLEAFDPARFVRARMTGRG